MYVIGLTGGIACGKSTVAKRLKEKYQAPLLDTDRIAWDMSAPGEPLWQSYVDRYGQEKALLPNGHLDRAAIGKIVFSQPEERIWVDRMSHPLIKEEVRRRLKRCREAGQRVAVVDVPLLFEAGWEPLADEIWVVYVDEATQLARLIERNQLPEALARQRIASQMPLAEKKRRAGVVIDNTGGLEATLAQVDAAWDSLETRQKRRGGNRVAQT